MFGLDASDPAKKSLKIFQENNINTIVELGAGLGRDSIFFSLNNLSVTSLDYSKSGINLINKKINDTVIAIKDFDPDILFTVDSPDFTLRVAERVKKQNSNIKTIHYVAPQVWVWREGRVKKIKKFIDHILLLFNFEKLYFD